jgi:hypothetical protein
MSSESTTVDDLQLVEGILDRIASNLTVLVDREIAVDAITAQRATTRPAGQGQVHISFRLAFVEGESVREGSLVVPLPDAITLACYLMMYPEEEVLEYRGEDAPDRAQKDALLEIGNFVASACEEVLRRNDLPVNVRSRGCQGVRADVRPAFAYREQDELVVGRAQVSLHEFPAFETILMFPALGVS